MLEENIKRYRKEKQMSQEELAIKCNVVRQTVSKWENGQSVPDADILIQLSKVLDASVAQLLGTNQEEIPDLSKELERVNQELAQRVNQDKLNQQRNKKRNSILFLTFLALLSALIVKNEMISLVLITVCLLSALWVLYRNLTLLSSVHNKLDSRQVKALRMNTIFSGCILLIGVILAFILEREVINQDIEAVIVVGIVSIIILFGGYICPKLPFTRHTGLRLPWTVSDEDTWNVAHRIIGVISIPLVLVYITLVFLTQDIEISSMIIILSWVLIPGLLSLWFYYRKYRGY